MLMSRLRRRERLLDAALWLVPLAALAAVYLAPNHFLSASRIVTYLLALGVLALAATRPDLSLITLVVLLPFQGLLLAKLWAWGAPVSVVKGIGTWKEALALGVILAGAKKYLATGRRADRVDMLAVSFVVLAAVYFVAQPVIDPSVQTSSGIRALGFRETAGFVLLLLGARHAPLPDGFAAKAGRAVLLAGVIVAAIGIYEAILPDAWNRFAVGTMEYTRYQVAVLGTTPINMWSILTHGQIGGGQVVRVGSVFFSPLTAGFYLLIGFAVGLERTLRRARVTTGLLPTLIITAGLVLTQTRSAIIGALLIALLAFQPTGGRQRHFRTQVVLVLGLLALIAIPAAAASGVLSRFSLLSNSHDVSTHGHTQGFWTGLNGIVHHPLGQGLGTGAGTGQRFSVHGTTIPENNYLQVGDELGILALILFVALTAALIFSLHRVSRARDDPLLTATWAAAAGLAATAWFLQTWSDFSVSWTFWGLAGAMLGTRSRLPARGDARRTHQQDRERREPEPASDRAGVGGPPAATRPVATGAADRA